MYKHGHLLVSDRLHNAVSSILGSEGVLYKCCYFPFFVSFPIFGSLLPFCSHGKHVFQDCWQRTLQRGNLSTLCVAQWLRPGTSRSWTRKTQMTTIGLPGWMHLSTHWIYSLHVAELQAFRQYKIPILGFNGWFKICGKVNNSVFFWNFRNVFVLTQSSVNSRIKVWKKKPRAIFQWGDLRVLLHFISFHFIY